VRNLVNRMGLPLALALVPATRVPAGVLGPRKGRLVAGYDADAVLLDSDLRPTLTLVEAKSSSREAQKNEFDAPIC